MKISQLGPPRPPPIINLEYNKHMEYKHFSLNLPLPMNYLLSNYRYIQY